MFDPNLVLNVSFFRTEGVSNYGPHQKTEVDLTAAVRETAVQMIA
jgi:hypothetical protein